MDCNGIDGSSQRSSFPSTGLPKPEREPWSGYAYSARRKAAHAYVDKWALFSNEHSSLIMFGSEDVVGEADDDIRDPMVDQIMAEHSENPTLLRDLGIQLLLHSGLTNAAVSALTAACSLDQLLAGVACAFVRAGLPMPSLRGPRRRATRV